MIELENITKIYRTGKVEVPTIRGITLNIKQGEMVALIGTSDSGKSTLMNIVGFLDKPTLGRYILDGVDVTLATSEKKRPVYTFVLAGYSAFLAVRSLYERSRAKLRGTRLTIDWVDLTLKLGFATLGLILAVIILLRVGK